MDIFYSVKTLHSSAVWIMAVCVTSQLGSPPVYMLGNVINQLGKDQTTHSQWPIHSQTLNGLWPTWIRVCRCRIKHSPPVDLKCGCETYVMCDLHWGSLRCLYSLSKCVCSVFSLTQHCADLNPLMKWLICVFCLSRNKEDVYENLSKGKKDVKKPKSDKKSGSVKKK